MLCFLWIITINIIQSTVEAFTASAVLKLDVTSVGKRVLPLVPLSSTYSTQ